MKIFKTEIRDGVAEAVAKNTSIAVSAAVSPFSPTENDVQIARAFMEDFDSLDLYYLKAILASVGWNKNDDIFDREEMWKARSSPEDKQFNYMHDERDIIGHITGAYILDESGNRVDDLSELANLPDKFDVVMGSVLYKSWSDKDLRERMESIIAEIKNGDSWFVSMECLFPAFDYGLIDKEGQFEILKREETSAFLTKHLRAYGGSGEYNGYKVGRVLRDFSFSGVGLVRNPANPRSVIIKTAASLTEEKNMNEDLEALKNELAEAKKMNDEMKKKMDEAKADTETSISSLSAQLSDLQAALAAEKEEKEKMAEEMNRMKKEKTMMKRKADLSEAGFSGEESEDLLTKFESLDDSTFDVVVATMKSRTNAAKYKEDEKEEEVEAKKTKADEEVDSNEADAGVLDSAKADEDVPMGDSGEQDDFKSFASEWFSKNVLKSTANIKD